MMPSRNMDPGDSVAVEDDVPQAMAFTVTFDSAKATSNKFIKRHIRNLSLPITKIYENKSSVDNAVNGKTGKRQGNHSEGYFSSDPDEEHPKTNNDMKINKTRAGRVTPEGAAVESRSPTDREMEEEEEDDGAGSDAVSETGTYTIERESPEVIAARLSIDANFGMEQQASASMNTSRDSTTWINEWATQVINHQNQTQSITETHSKSTVSRTQQAARGSLGKRWPTDSIRGPTKIPSPLTTRARFGTKNTARVKEISETSVTIRPPSHTQRNKVQEDCSDSETERILKTTEKVMSALAARLSLDSGGESEGETSRRGDVRRPAESSPRGVEAKNTMTTTTTTKTTTTRYNRAFSLRRDRLSDGGSDKSPGGRSPPPPAVRGVSSGACVGRRVTESVKPSTQQTYSHQSRPKQPQITPQTQALSRTDTGRFSMRATKQPPKVTPTMGNPSVNKKPAGGGRSNSTLSSKEVEFQNWKRRKSYDPMKAAAEGRKKEAARRPPTTTTTTPKSPMNSVWRSASFHGTRQLGGGPSSSEEEEETTLSVEEDDWPVPQGPKTSLQNSPRGSKGSLYSNSSNNSPHQRQNLEGVDILLVSALYRLANKQKGTVSCILKKLRCLYDEESQKYRLITSALEQLDQCEPPSAAPGSPHMSPSRELASTLTVSKRLNSTFKILNEVLFDEVDFE